MRSPAINWREGSSDQLEMRRGREINSGSLLEMMRRGRKGREITARDETREGRSPH